ncbi:MAG: hypothetical protein LUG13_08350 [Oscillospiraceae bacterium]|nr:hypothetical protein [Oscillospiraceae bacterium]
MTREKILRDRLEMASHNLLCYSENLLMDKPKAGYEAEHKAAAEEVEMLQVWLKEFQTAEPSSTIVDLSSEKFWDDLKQTRYEILLRQIHDLAQRDTYGDPELCIQISNCIINLYRALDEAN